MKRTRAIAIAGAAAMCAAGGLRIESPPPGSYLAASLKLICASAPTEAAGDSEENDAGGPAVGTAWGVDKG